MVSFVFLLCPNTLPHSVVFSCLATSPLSSSVSLVFINRVYLLFPLSCDFLSVPVSRLRLAPQLGPFLIIWCQFWGPLSFYHLHFGAYPVLSSPPQAPGQAAKPPAAPNPPAPARPQRPPSHLPESGPTAHRARGWGPPGGPAGGAWQPGWGRGVPLQVGWRGTIAVQSWKLGPRDGTDPDQRHGCQVIPVSIKYQSNHFLILFLPIELKVSRHCLGSALFIAFFSASHILAIIRKLNCSKFIL